MTHHVDLLAERKSLNRVLRSRLEWQQLDRVVASRREASDALRHANPLAAPMTLFSDRSIWLRLRHIGAETHAAFAPAILRVSGLFLIRGPISGPARSAAYATVQRLPTTSQTGSIGTVIAFRPASPEGVDLPKSEVFTATDCNKVICSWRDQASCSARGTKKQPIPIRNRGSRHDRLEDATRTGEIT